MSEQEPIQWKKMTSEQRDMLVAEKVMGWKPVQCPGVTTYEEVGNDHLVKEEHRDWMFCVQCGAESLICDQLEHGIIPPQPYSQSMDAAWLVLQEMIQRQPYPYQKPLPQQFTGHFIAFANAMFESIGWGADQPAWGEIHPASEMFDMAARWTPETICLAALKACGVLIEEEQ